MKKKKNNPKLKKQVSVSVVLTVFFLLIGGHFLFGQQRFMLNQKDALKFKLAKQQLQKGQALLDNGKLKKAEKALKKCIEFFPQFSHADYHLSQIFYKEADFQQALYHIDRARKNYKFVADYWVNSQLEYKKQLRDQKWKLEESKRNMEQRLATKNYNQSSQGAAYAAKQELENRIANARIDIARIDSKLNEPIPSVSEMPAEYHYLYGNILFKFKKFADSFNSYLEAVRVNPCYVNALNNLANLKFMARKYKDALAYLEKAEECGGKVNQKFKEVILKAMGN